MVTLPGLHEFMTDGWRDEARRFLEREVATRPGLQPFSVSERFTDAPPHLGLPDDTGAWSLRYDGQAITVEPGFDATADAAIEGDYSAALVMAQRVGFGGSGAMASAWREMVQGFGKDAVRAHGRIADPVAGALMADLHDHLARRTMDNPDLLHRATRQGLTGHIREMEEQ